VTTKVSWCASEAVLEILFGCGPRQVATDLVLTPIPAFYTELVAQASRAVEYRGWWRLAVIEDDSRRYNAVQHFEGNRVVDALYALSGPTSRVAFLGLAGGLADGIEIGRLVSIQSAVRDGEPSERCQPDDADAVDPVVSLTVDGLLEPPDVVTALAEERHAQVVDLEAHHFYRAARRTGALASMAWGLVTDRPASQPFWQVPIDDRALRLAAGRLTSLLHDWLDSQAGGTERVR
jgi:hypothetical protein